MPHQIKPNRKKYNCIKMININSIWFFTCFFLIQGWPKMLKTIDCMTFLDPDYVMNNFKPQNFANEFRNFNFLFFKFSHNFKWFFSIVMESIVFNGFNTKIACEFQNFLQILPRKCQQQVSKASYVRNREEQLSRKTCECRERWILGHFKWSWLLTLVPVVYLEFEHLF